MLPTYYFNGLGSGGGIYISCRTFTGSGTLAADGLGADKWVGGVGGGGRIAVLRLRHTFTGTASATNGFITNPFLGFPHGMDGAEPGTIFWGTIPESGTIFCIR